MPSDYILLMSTGIAGILLLLALEVFSGGRNWRKPLAALCLSVLTVLWGLLPQTARWPLSVWSPSTLLGGVLLWDLNPTLWRLGLALGIALSSVAWVEVLESRPALPLSGPLALTTLLVAWHALAGGSLLTTLTVWALFDVLWAVAGLLAGNDGERVTFGLFAHGIASLCLWASFLLLARDGGGTLWWLLWPSPAVAALLVSAAFLRIGLYPFQVVFPRRLRAVGLLVLLPLLGPVLGFGLLARILLLPGLPVLPGVIATMGLVSVVWGGIRAWMERGKSTLVWASYGLLGGIVAGTAATGLTGLLAAALGTWLLSLTVLLLSRRRDPRAIRWSWPGLGALLLLLGTPPSPLGQLFRAALVMLPWGGRVALLVGWTFISAALLQWLCQPGGLRTAACTAVPISVTPLWAWQQVGLGVGLFLPLAGIVLLMTWVAELAFTWGGFLLWLFMLVMMMGVFWLTSSRPVRRVLTPQPQGHKSELLSTAEGLIGILDLQWLYRALWRGLEHLLSFVRVLFEVIEGSSALLWSLLVLLVLFLVVLNR